MERLEVRKGIQRPAGIQRASNGQDKYPFEQMKERDDFIFVPWWWYFGDDATEESAEAERWNEKKHRNRVNSAARAYALKQNKAAQEAEGFDLATFKPLRFTVAATKDETGRAGIGVWRD